MTNEQQFRQDMKAAGYDRVKYNGRLAVKLDKFPKLVGVGEHTLVHVTYKWESEHKVYVFPVAPEAEYEPAFHLIKRCVCQFRGGSLHTIVFCTSSKQAKFVENLFRRDPKSTNVTNEPSIHVKRIFKAASYKVKFYADNEKVAVVYVANKCVGKYLVELWEGDTRKAICQKKLPLVDYKVPDPPLAACKPF